MAVHDEGGSDGLSDTQVYVGLSRAYSIPVSEAMTLAKNMDRAKAEAIARESLGRSGGDSR